MIVYYNVWVLKELCFTDKSFCILNVEINKLCKKLMLIFN